MRSSGVRDLYALRTRVAALIEAGDADSLDTAAAQQTSSMIGTAGSLGSNMGSTGTAGSSTGTAGSTGSTGTKATC